MKQTVYCNCDYCEYCEDGKCVSKVLHIRQLSGCAEFKLSQEKMDAKMANAKTHPLFDDDDSKPEIFYD